MHQKMTQGKLVNERDSDTNKRLLTIACNKKATSNKRKNSTQETSMQQKRDSTGNKTTAFNKKTNHLTLGVVVVVDAAALPRSGVVLAFNTLLF